MRHSYQDASKAAAATDDDGSAQDKYDTLLDAQGVCGSY
jgi:hypothetical protein